MRKIDLTSFSVATSETARSINRRVVLDLIRTRQPISRADLARLSGLHPSTISLIADELVEDRWVTEGAFGELPRGRKPRFLHLNVDRIGIIGINVRSSNTTIGLADLSARFIAQESFNTPQNPLEFIDALTNRVQTLIKLHPRMFFAGIGVSLPGRVNPISQRLIVAPNLGWRNIDIQTPLREATGLSIKVENVANACALAELWFQQRTHGISDLIAVTVSEGIGAGIIINGQLVRGKKGLAGEFGHASLDENGLPCKCGLKGRWEVYASNTAAINEYTTSISGNQSPLPNSDLVNPQLSYQDLLRLAAQGDLKAVAAIERMAHYLGRGLALLITGIAPSMIVLIGEITQAWERISPIIKRVLNERLPAYFDEPVIIPAQASTQPRLRGSVALIFQDHFGVPAVG